MAEVSQEVQNLLRLREERRAAKDFAAADQLRLRIHELGFDVVDSAEGSRLDPVREGGTSRISAAQVDTVLDEPASADFSVQWLVQGWPEDAVRGVASFRRNQGGRRVQNVIVDCAGSDPSVFDDGAELVLLEEDPGWAAARNAGLKRAAGAIVLVVDGSVEATGDVFGPVEAALADPAVGIVGPFGIDTDDMRSFHDAEGPEVHAIEGYLMAFRRETLASAGFFDEKFRFYRTADIEYSFRVRGEGLGARIVPLPIERHEHRMWNSTAPAERERLSKRNYYRFLEVWRERKDLIRPL